MADTVTTLTCDERAPSRAREIVTRTLTGSPQARVTDEALLVVSELVTNAVLHGRCESTDLSVCTDADSVLIGVSDRNGEAPTIRPSSEEPGGKGMRIVDRVAERWWVDGSVLGKTVWCRLRVADPSTDGRRP